MVAAAARELTSQTGERTSLGGHGGRLWHYAKATSSDTLSTARSCYLIFSTRDKESKFSLKAHAWHKVSTHSVNFLHMVWTFYTRCELFFAQVLTAVMFCLSALSPVIRNRAFQTKPSTSFFPSVCLLGILLIAMARITNVSTPIQKD